MQFPFLAPFIFFISLAILYPGKAVSQEGNGQRQENITAFRAGTHHDSSDRISVIGEYNKAKAALEHKEYDEVLNYIEQGLKLDPAYMPFLYLKATAFSKLNRYAEAAPLFEMLTVSAHGNSELHLLAINNLIKLYGENTKQLTSELKRYFSCIDQQSAPVILQNVAQGYTSHDKEFKDIVRALLAAGQLTEPMQKALQLYLDGNASQTAKLIEQMAPQNIGPSPAHNPFWATMYMLTAEEMQAQMGHDAALANQMYSSALALGYNKEKLYATKAEKSFNNQDFSGAATIYASFWRQASDPAIWAAEAAKSYARANRLDKSVEILKSALVASPNHHYLLGLLYYYLDTSGNTAALSALSGKLEQQSQIIALDFGKYLVAQRRQDQQETLRYAEKIQQHLKFVSSMHIQDTAAPIIDKLPQYAARSPLVQQTNLMRNMGWTMWHDKRYADAYAYWRDSAMVNPRNERSAVPVLCALLIQENMIPQALELFKIYYPSLSPISLVMSYVANNQWYVAQPLLANGAASAVPAAWQKLLAALAALKNGTEQQVADTAKSLFAGAAEISRIDITLPVNDSGLTSIDLNKAYYGKLLLEYLTELSRQSYTQQIADMLRTNLLQYIAPDQAATILSNCGLKELLQSNTEAAGALLTKALQFEPARPDAHIGMALVAKIRGDENAAGEHLAAGMSCPLPVKDYVLGRIAMLDGNRNEAVGYFTHYLNLEPQNLSIRYDLFNIFLSMPNYPQAIDILNFFEKNQQNPEAVMYLALAELELGNYAHSEKLFRQMLKQRPGSRPVLLGLVQALKRQERFEEADALLAANHLQDPEVLTVLRNKAEQAERDANPLEMRRYAEAYLQLSPDSPYLNTLYNSSLRDEYRAETERLERLRRDRIKLDAGKLETDGLSEEYLAQLRAVDPKNPAAFKGDPNLLDMAEDHASGLLTRNDLQRNALAARLDIALQRENYVEAADMSRFMASAFPYDEHYQMQAALHGGAASLYRESFKNLEEKSALGINSAGMALAFLDVARRPRTNAYTARDLIYYLDSLQDAFKTVTLSEFTTRQQGKPADKNADKIPLLFIVGQIAPDELIALDREMERRNAKGVLLVSEQSFAPGTPQQLPDTKLLQHLRQSGRWDLVLTDTMGRTIVNNEGRTVSFWAEKGARNGQQESYDDMRTRWRDTLMRIRNSAKAAGFDISAWSYPGGDYGQLTLDGDEASRAAYTDAVKEVFAVAFVPSDDGYHTVRFDPLNLPIRNVYGPIDERGLKRMAQQHPTRLALMTEGLISSWNGQLPRAERLFAKSENLGLSPEDLTYYRANNAVYDGDTPYALELARKSRELEPDALRSEDVMARAEKLLRPRVGYEPLWWYDSDGRSYYEHTIRASTHVRENLALSIVASDIIWATRDKAEHGYAVGAGLRYYVMPQHWLDLSAQDVMRDKGSGFARWKAAWHGAYATNAFKLNGIYDISYGRDSIETLESVDQEIYANQFTASTQARLFNWVSLEAQIYDISRTDGNNTRGLNFSPKLILWDKPVIRIGYLFNTADSDSHPKAYYAPQEYYNHMAVADASIKIFDDFSITGMFGYGSAISKDKTWEAVTRYGGGFNWAFTQDLSFQGNYQHLQLPTYTLDQFSLGVQYVF